jgi:hypothetical protein
MRALFSGIGRPAAWVAADIVRIGDGKLAEHAPISTPRYFGFGLVIFSGPKQSRYPCAERGINCCSA